MTNETEIENEIQAKGLNAPRLTPADIDAVILNEHFFTARQAVNANGTGDEVSKNEHKSLSLLTFCILVLKNGMVVTGESACASPENFDAEIGRKIARENARSKVWQLEGYLLKQRLHEARNNNEI